jgi:hypothetical protein
MPHPSSIIPDPLRAPSMAEIGRARELYQYGFTIARCLAAGHMSTGTLYHWLDGGPHDENGARMLPPIPRRRTAVLGKRRRPLAGSQVSLVARLYRTAERQALDIEQRLARPSASTPERERDLRMLTSLVQAVRALAAIAPAGNAKAEEEETTPRDMDAFRNELARRIRGLVEEAEARRGTAMPVTDGAPETNAPPRDA